MGVKFAALAALFILGLAAVTAETPADLMKAERGRRMVRTIG
jgi:hypothetical protein